VHRANVAIVRRESGVAIVKGELAAGDLVVVEGTPRLREGGRVVEVGEYPAVDGGATGGNPPAVSGGGAPAAAPS
jgi:hypothetical protein